MKNIVVLVALLAVLLLASCTSLSVGAGYSSNGYDVGTVDTETSVTESGFSLTYTAMLFNLNKPDSGFHLYKSGYCSGSKSWLRISSSLGPSWVIKTDEKVSVVAGFGLSLGGSIPYSNSAKMDPIIHIGLEALFEGRFKIWNNHFIGLKGTFNFNLPNQQTYVGPRIRNDVSRSDTTYDVSNDMGYAVSLVYGW